MGQFYLVDVEDMAFAPPIDITLEIEEQNFFSAPTGLVIYTQDCLQQIHVAIYDTEPDHAPAEEMSGRPWTRVRATKARFPSRKFTISSPSSPSPLPAGPVFLLETKNVTVRISWMESTESRDDSVPIEPDVIAIALWSA